MVQWVDGAIANPPPAGEVAVRDAGRALRIRFPLDFLSVASARQGARPVPQRLVLPDGSGSGVEHLLHFEDEPFMSNIVSRHSMLDGVLAKGEIPFAEALGGDVFLFDYRKTPETPSVAYWSVSGGKIALAATFTDFLGMLQE